MGARATPGVGTWLVGAAALAALAGSAGCLLAQPAEDAQASPDAVVSSGDTSAVLKSTLLLETGCAAAKVGPRHLLLAARCVADARVFAAGKTLRFKIASAAPDPSSSSKADAGDAGQATGPAVRSVVVADVQIHPQYVSQCKGDACAVGNVAASDAPDLAVVVLTANLDTVPSVPIDLDAVGQGDPLLVVGSGCTRIDGQEGPTQTTRTIAVPSQSAGHVGSPYESAPQLISQLQSSYLVTAGPAWRVPGTRVCKSDIGAPVFRGGAAAVAGVTSTYTTWHVGGVTPVTVEHTRLDAQSRFKVGAWLASLGVSTIHSCSESAVGCTKHDYDAGLPKEPASGDVTGGGSDAGAADAMVDDASVDPNAPREEPLPSPDDPYAADPGSEDDYADAAVSPKKKAATGGCSAAPTSSPGGDLGTALGLGVGLAMALSRRRRSK